MRIERLVALIGLGVVLGAAVWAEVLPVLVGTGVLLCLLGLGIAEAQSGLVKRWHLDWWRAAALVVAVLMMLLFVFKEDVPVVVEVVGIGGGAE